jgi:DUF1680 family protein
MKNVVSPNKHNAVVDTSTSPFALFRPVPISAVKMGQGFWQRWMEVNYKAGIPSFLAWMERDDQTDPFPTFARTTDTTEINAALDRMRDCFLGRNEQGLQHSWRACAMEIIEACAFVLQSEEVPHIRELLDELVAGVVAAHEHKEFFDEYYGKDFENSYQMATPGHLIQSAVAHYRTTGNTDFLDCACRVADVILEKFPDRTCTDHPVLEMALVELYRATGEERYLKYARQILQALIGQPDEIGQGTADYFEDGVDHFGKHVVRQTYLLAGGADYLIETGDPEFQDKLDALWNDMTTCKIQITGQLATENMMPERIVAEPFQISSSVFDKIVDHVIRGFELCEAVGNIYWNWRMFSATGQAKYIDLFERTLYNGFIAHVSIDGSRFHYVSPLASDGDFPPRNIYGSPEANCCPPNALRMIPSVPGYIFSTSDAGLWIHLYDNCSLNWHLQDGTGLQVVQNTRYPWDGLVTIEVNPEKTAQFALNLRIPGWCSQATVKVNGQAIDATVQSGTYCRLQRTWQKGDVVTLDMAMPVVAMDVDSRAHDLRNYPVFDKKTAVMRGPLVYCFEGVDNPDFDVWSIHIPLSQGGHLRDKCSSLYEPIENLDDFEAVFDERLLAGVVCLNGTGSDGKGHSAKLKAVPYYAWHNRGQSQMRVWVNTE